MSLNIQGLTSNKTELEWTIHDWEPLIVCLSETHITKDIISSEIDIEGYNTNINYSTSRHTGGVITYVKKGYKYKVILDEALALNVWMLGIELLVKQQKYNILNIYHSPHASDAVFLEKFDEVLEEFSSRTGLLIIVGDFNIDWLGNSHYCNKLRDIVAKNGLYQRVDTYTRITKKSATVIDLLITNYKTLNHRVYHTPRISDHSIVTTTINIQCNQGKICKKAFRNFRTFNELNFQLELMDTDWSSNSTDTNLLAEKLVGSIQNTLDTHAPIEIKEIDRSRTKKKWWTPQIGEKIKVRNGMYRKAILTENEDDWSNFRKQRNIVVDLIRKEKQIYYHTKIDQVKNNSAEMWKTLKQLIGYSDKSSTKEGIVFNNKLVENAGEIAEKFNIYFLDSIDQIVSIPSEDQMKIVLNNMKKCDCRMDKFTLLGFSQLKKIVREMKHKKSSVDGITTQVLKLAFEAIGDRFLCLINNILEYGKFPIGWKTSTIVPIEKKANTIKCEEYRPINMVPIYEKLLELVVNKQIVDYIEGNNLLTKYQSGFRKQNSCESALQSVLCKWKDALDNRMLVGVVFLDLRRAFETVNRKLLLLKLKNFGMGSTVVNLLREYLDDRMQEVRYDDSVSVPRPSEHGVPQGTVMGPNLFILYINDIVHCVNKCRIQLFADDTLLYMIGENVCDIVEVINSELRVLHEWFHLNSLSVNIDKTKFMIIKSRYSSIDIKSHGGVYINNKKIEQVEECKYLGVMIDNSLTFSKHATYITGKIAKKVNVISRLRNHLSRWSKLLVYKTIVLPHLNYCATVLYLLNNTEIGNIQRKQNRAMRAILKCDRFTSIKEMLKETQLLSVKQTLFFNSMVVVYQIKNGLLAKCLLDGLVYVGDVHGYGTRARGNFYVRTMNTSFGQNSLFHRGLIEFDQLPMDVKNCQTVKMFKSRCRKYCLENVSV